MLVVVTSPPTERGSGLMCVSVLEMNKKVSRAKVVVTMSSKDNDDLVQWCLNYGILLCLNDKMVRPPFFRFYVVVLTKDLGDPLLSKRTERVKGLC